MNGEIGCSIMCRACMKVDGILLPMYGDDMISKKNLPDKLADLASIQIDKYDGLPSVLCAKCAYRTDSFYDFKLQVQATEKKLRKMFQGPSAPNISPKYEIIYKNSDGEEYCSLDDNLQIESAENGKTAEIVHTEKVEAFDIKPILEDYSCDEGNVLETLDFADDPACENDDTSDLRNLDQIFIPENTNSRHVESQSMKHELPDEIKDILQSQNLGYTLLYIPSEDEVDFQENQQPIESDESTIKEISEKISYKENTSQKKIRKNPPKNSESPEKFQFDADKRKTASIHTIIDELPKPAKLPSKTAKKCHPKVPKENPNKDEESESDYFVDPKENLLGSLNDTILRIKEIKTDGKGTNYQCTLCMQNYEKLTAVLAHTVDNHVPSSGPFFCVVCEKDCASHRDLRSHVKTHSGKYPYTCFICNKAYSMKRYLKRHMSCHTDFPRHRCPKCGQRFGAKCDLENHVTTHVHGGAPFACSQCPRSFNHKGNYKRHLISHLDPNGLHLPKYPCDVCGKRFLNNRTLQIHRRVHTGEKPFQCDICSRSFSQQGNLLNHLRIHSNPRSYTCEVCGKRFNQRATLRDHSLLHTGEKPYVCNVCGVAFTFSAALRRHMWTHASDKPFGCGICNARFVGKYDIKRHMKIHTDRPRTRRRRNQSKNEEIAEENSRDEMVGAMTSQVESDAQTIFIEQTFLDEDSGQIMQQGTKENVDSLLNLMEYG